MLCLKVSTHLAREWQSQMIGAPEGGYGLSQDQLATRTISIDDCQPGIFQDDLHETDQCPNGESQNDKCNRATRHRRPRLSQMQNGIEQEAADQSSKSAPNQSITYLGSRSLIETFGDPDC